MQDSAAAPAIVPPPEYDPVVENIEWRKAYDPHLVADSLAFLIRHDFISPSRADRETMMRTVKHASMQDAPAACEVCQGRGFVTIRENYTCTCYVCEGGRKKAS